jgi:rhomboid protease GluP
MASQSHQRLLLPLGPLLLALSASSFAVLSEPLRCFGREKTGTGIALDQSVLAAQHSRQLLEAGGVNKALLQAGEWWRLVVSQFLHVHAPHMLFNAISVLLVGALIERAAGWWWLTAIYIAGGCIGQYASVTFYPVQVSSGASQALMSLCGAALLICRHRIAYLIVISILVVQIALDIRAVGAVKAGHGWSFLAGIFLAAVAVLVSRRNVATRHVTHSPHSR